MLLLIRRLLSALAVPVLLAQALAPTLSAPVIAMLSSKDIVLACGGLAATAAALLLPLRVRSGAP